MSALTLPRRLVLFALLALVAVVTGCASYTPPPPQASTPPPTRCLANPQEPGGLRPLLFLFCVESP